MEPKRRQQIALAGLAAVLAGAALYIYWPRTAVNSPSTSNVRAGGTKAQSTSPTAPDVHLETLNGERPKPDELNRNLFRFKPKPPPPPPPSSTMSRPAVTPAPPPTGPSPPPDIPLKFALTIKDQSGDTVAVLIDPLGHQIFAREGQTIEGRYKVWRIGVESIEISYLDGRGRKTIRMNGS